jgi:YtkA-like
MRVRPIFWCLLTATCIGVLLLATLYRSHVPAILQVHVDRQTLVSSGMTSLDLQLTDPQGTPIEQAVVVPGAYMTNMDMQANTHVVSSLGNGRYAVKLHLDMAGPWAIVIHAQADGFAPQQKVLYVEVT